MMKSKFLGDSVRRHCFGCATIGRLDNVGGLELAGDTDGQALAGELVNDAQYPERFAMTCSTIQSSFTVTERPIAIPVGFIHACFGEPCCKSNSRSAKGTCESWKPKRLIFDKQ
jgi:hypothetical protein